MFQYRSRESNQYRKREDLQKVLARVPPRRSRVRQVGLPQVRRVDLEFLPRGGPILFLHPAIYLPVKFEAVSIKAASMLLELNPVHWCLII